MTTTLNLEKKEDEATWRRVRQNGAKVTMNDGR